VTKSEASHKIAKNMDVFADEINGLFEDGDQTPATKGDIKDLARQTLYLIGAVKDAILSMDK